LALIEPSSISECTMKCINGSGKLLIPTQPRDGHHNGRFVAYQ